MLARLPVCLLLAAAAWSTPAPGANDIVRCAVGGKVTYQHEPCPGSTVESRPRIPTEFPAPNVAERDRIFQREAALDRRLEARRDRELLEQQMREARAEREHERQRRELLAAQAQPQYLVAYPLWRGYGPARPVHHLPRHNARPIRR